MSRPARPIRNHVVVIGQGYVGLPLALRAVEAGFDVVGYDTDPDKVKRLGAADSFVEDVADERLEAALDTGRYLPSCDPDDCVGFGIAVITVPTPLKDRLPDLSHVEAAAELLAPLVRRGATVVLESTTYPGTTDELIGPILSNGSGLVTGIDFFLGYSPERIDPGNRVWRFENTPKVVSGVNPASLAVIDAFYSRLVEHTVAVGGTREAEMCKLLENTFRHVNIALVNELAMFAADLGVDIWEVLDAAQTKPFGFTRFNPGPGVGGHCLPIDPSYLSWKVKQSIGASFRFVELANEVNEHMPEYVVQRLTAAMNDRRRSVNGSRFGLVGFAYKRNTSDARESPSVAVADRLLALGAEVVAIDPHVDDEFLRLHATEVVRSIDDARDVDGFVLLVDHDEFDLEALAARGPYVLDTRGRMSGTTVERL